ncbi:MAG TPA: hypothetical protein VK586_14765, partial [Streptosporangiaceae bacterium]|nr:hypothetical protein [Streptosporangiaceae bacterium]
VASRVIACRAPAGPEAGLSLTALRAAYPDAGVLWSTDPAAELAEQAIAATPLTQGHELVVLRRTRSGRLLLGGYPLFPAGARRGDQCPLTIACEPADSRGTVLALVASAAPLGFRLLSVRSARIAPGTYRLTAELRGPGQVDFQGLPDILEAEQRSWPELIAMVPEELPRLVPAHLICAIEASGSQEEVRQRVAQVRQLLSLVADRRSSELSVSVIAYGPHAVSWGETDEPPAVLAWAVRPAAAAAALGGMPGRAADRPGYARAAQLECVLAEVGARLQSEPRRARPVLVTAGSRPAFPPRVDPRTEIIPCPHRSDWQRSLAELHEQQPGITFGAIRDAEPDGIWAELGRDALARRGAAADTTFAVSLGLLSATAQRIPFPLADAEPA